MQQWDAYFGALISASATIFGLAFVAYQVRSTVWRGDAIRRPVAWTTLWELATPMFFGLLYLTPVKPWSFIPWLADTPVWVVSGWILGGSGLLLITWHVISFWRGRERATSFDRWQVSMSWLPILTFSLMAFSPHLGVKASVALWLVFSGAGEAWISLAVPARTQPSTAGLCTGRRTRREVARG